ncbi:MULTISPECIES: glycosyltransferase 87 family protein [unclassified Streptomyces]|uniref:glycosyltransferase 87 family protein n=1 Tax=Streptomyces sp. NPDC127129 TaxID=3345373 RepID=UPI0036378F8F
MISPRTATAGGLLAVLITVLVCTVRQDVYYADPGRLSWWYAASWALFAAAALALRTVPPRQAVVLLLAGSALVAATGLVAPPRTSTDAYRYAWDGRVQAAGIPPYDHAPADPELAPLRDDWLFPRGAAACRRPDVARVAAPDTASSSTSATPHCTRINRPTVHTIYPPIAEGYFLGVHLLAPDGVRLKALQIGGALLSVGITGLLLLILRRRGDPRTAVFWAWCPAVPLEAVNNAHVDALGVLFAVAGLGLVARHRVTGGALMGAAVAVKLMPAILLPGALSGVRRTREAAAILVPAGAVTVLAYLPYVLISDGSVLGYLGGYVEEEGYGDAGAGNRYALLRLVLPPSWAVPALVAALLVCCAHVVRRGDPERPWSGALLVTGTAFLLVTPGYSWYALFLVALVALDGRWEWLLVAVAGAATYVAGRAFDDSNAVVTLAYAVAAVVVLAGAWLRRGRGTATPRGRRAAEAVDPRSDVRLSSSGRRWRAPRTVGWNAQDRRTTARNEDDRGTWG